VAVNLSPTRESLLDNVSSTRIFKLVPIGTSGATTVAVLRGARLSLGLVRLWALTSRGIVSMAITAMKDTSLFEEVDFIL
jgi:hypothetical protein